MKIGIDLMGGDYAPKTSLEGLELILSSLPDDSVQFVLFGEEKSAEAFLKERNISEKNISIVPTTNEIEMGEAPLKAVMTKKSSAIVTGMVQLATRKIDGFLSAGNTGAILASVMGLLKPIPGIIRPCITIPLPKQDDTMGVLTDAGLNADCKPELLEQFALLSSLYIKALYNREKPSVSLLNIGSEPDKGNILTKATYKLLDANSNINFLGNIEGHQLYYNNKADVVVTDGFTGNVVLKEIESVYRIIKSRNVKDEYFERYNFVNYGGTSLLGVDAAVVIGHGASNGLAMKNMIQHTIDIVKADIPNKIKTYFSNVKT